MEYTAYEVLKDILSSWDISDLSYFDFYKSENKVKYGRKGYDYEIQMSQEELENLINVIRMLNQGEWIEVYE